MGTVKHDSGWHILTCQLFIIHFHIYLKVGNCIDIAVRIP